MNHPLLANFWAKFGANLSPNLLQFSDLVQILDSQTSQSSNLLSNWLNLTDKIVSAQNQFQAQRKKYKYFNKRVGFKINVYNYLQLLFMAGASTFDLENQSPKERKVFQLLERRCQRCRR